MNHIVLTFEQLIIILCASIAVFECVQVLIMYTLVKTFREWITFSIGSNL